MLGLVMIVKDEAAGIVATLESVRPWIDRWTILDTGSTDGTQDLIRKTLADIPGELHEEPFVDFSTSRNRALELHGEVSAFTLMLSGDELLHDGARLRAFCEAHRSTSAGAFYVEVRSPGLAYKSARLARASAGWRYTGVTHEVLVGPDSPPTITVPAVFVEHGNRRTAAESRSRWELDLKLLRTAPVGDTRAAFYTAQTLECLGMFRDALAAYDYRISLGGWAEEVYESLFRKARVLGRLGCLWAEVQQAYLDAYAFDPRHAEPLYEVAKHWHALEQYALAYLFASRAAALPVPDVALFVDAEVYAWRAADLAAVNGWYLAEKTGDSTVLEAGHAAASHALAGRPDDERLRANRDFYLRAREAEIQRWAEAELAAATLKTS